MNLGLPVIGWGLSVRRCWPRIVGWAEYVCWLLSVDHCGLGAKGQLFLVDSCKQVGCLMLVAVDQLR